MSSTVPTPTPDLARPAALAAFLRGVERRAAVLAELQAGDPTIGDAALTRAMAAFREEAVDAPMADWPRRFWCALLAQPALRRATRARPPAFVPASSPAVRAALLLRLAAGLDEAEAAAVLDVAPGSLRRAVLRALPVLPDGAPDAAVWMRLQADVQTRIRGLPTERSLRLARMREGALAGRTERFFPRHAFWTGHRIAAAAVTAVTLVALAASFWADAPPGPDVRIVALPPAGQPASTYSRTSGLIAHPDFDLLADPAAERLSRDAAFLAWTIGHVPVAEVVPVPAATVDVPESESSSDAP